ncbi:hypothetical protein CIB48_g8121 [Xylaria polymorpha]|nr:hypothetical protein CIB48_g8121 [Xylaria polymorpha]
MVKPFRIAGMLQDPPHPPISPAEPTYMLPLATVPVSIAYVLITAVYTCLRLSTYMGSCPGAYVGANRSHRTPALVGFHAGCITKYIPNLYLSTATATTTHIELSPSHLPQPHLQNEHLNCLTQQRHLDHHLDLNHKAQQPPGDCLILPFYTLPPTKVDLINMSQVTPEVLWAQRSSKTDAEKNFVYLTISVPDVPKENLKLDLKPTSLAFHGHSETLKRTYHLDINFFDEIDVENSKIHHTARNVEMKLRKKDLKEEYWPRLLKDAAKVQFVKTDFDKWVDEDEQNEVADDDMSQFGGGMGTFDMPPPHHPPPDTQYAARRKANTFMRTGGMPGGMPGGMGGMGGMGGDFGGIDFSKLGGMGGMGGAGSDDEEDEDEEDDIPALEGEEEAKSDAKAVDATADAAKADK